MIDTNRNYWFCPNKVMHNVSIEVYYFENDGTYYDIVDSETGELLGDYVSFDVLENYYRQGKLFLDRSIEECSSLDVLTLFE